MIIKHYELKKKKLKKNEFILLYGKNSGLIEETIEHLKKIISNNIETYEEKEIINNIEEFKEKVYNKTFFDNEKLIIIKRVSDKLYKAIEELVLKDIEDISILLISDNLDKKSKLRIFFEKNSKTLCIPFYDDNSQTLNIFANNFIKEKKIKLSQQDLNLLIDRARGDRANLKNELAKIESLSLTQKIINTNHILKLSNLAEDYDYSDLIDSSLLKNKKKLLKILNENNFSSEECILIIRILLSRLKRLYKLKALSGKTGNIEYAIQQYKPPIFWREKETVEQHINIWSLEKIKKLIIETNNLEFLIKKNPPLAVIATTNFILNAAN